MDAGLEPLCISALAICWRPGLCHTAVAHYLFLCISGSVQKNPCPLVLLALSARSKPDRCKAVNALPTQPWGSRARVRRDQRQMSAVDLYGREAKDSLPGFYAADLGWLIS